MARNTPTRSLPSGLSGAGEYVRCIPRADRSTLGGAPGGVYPDDVPSSATQDRIPPTLDRVGPRSATSPLGQSRTNR